MSCSRFLSVLLVLTCPIISYAQSGFENLKIRVKPPVCFGDVCAVMVRFVNFETLDPDLFVEEEELRTCGSTGTNPILPSDFDSRGKSRTIVTVRSDRGLVEKNCNPDFMPQEGMKSRFAYRTFYFDSDAMPRFLKFGFRDRENLTSYTLKADVPPPVPASEYACDRYVESYGTYARIRNLTLEKGELYTICFEQPPSTPYFPFFEISLVNLGDASCSDVRMRAISPDGQHIASDFGPSPGLRPDNMAGAWKVQLTLVEGCNKYEMYVDY